MVRLTTRNRPSKNNTVHIVYTIVNLSNREKGVKPYLYIGSKTNCKVDNGKIYSLKSGKVYWSSSKPVRESIRNGDAWELETWFEVTDRSIICQVEGKFQDSVQAKDNDIYYNKSHANLKFNSTDEETRKAISESKKGKVFEHMRKESYWSHLQNPDIRRKNSNSCTGSVNVISAAKKRNEKWSKDPDYVKWRAELTSRIFKGRKLTEHEIWLRMHDERYKAGRKMTNQQVWSIRFGEHKDLSLGELMVIYPDVTKPTLCRVKNFKVFKDIKEDWNDKAKNSSY